MIRIIAMALLLATTPLSANSLGEHPESYDAPGTDGCRYSRWGLIPPDWKPEYRDGQTYVCPDTPRMVVLIVGQSNATSQAAVIYAPDDYLHWRKAQLWDLKQPGWQHIIPGSTTSDPFKRDPVPSFGLETPMADVLHSDFIRAAWGGTCAGSWVASRVASTIEAVIESGRTVDHIVWVQGECDAKRGTTNYATTEQRVIEMLRDGLGNVPVFSVLLNDTEENKLVNAAKKANVFAIPSYHVVDVNSINYSDGVHYDTTGTITMGARIANKILSCGV